MFDGRAMSLPKWSSCLSGAPFGFYLVRLASGLVRKYKVRLEMLAMDNHSSLFRKQYDNTDLRLQFFKTFFHP
jgi:hypothetical protein